MEYPLYFNNNNNNYFIIINQAVNYNLVLEFETFTKLLISNEILSNSTYIEYNDENLKQLLNKFNILYNTNIKNRFNNWLDVFNFYKDI
jgi:hypothetical protein